MPFANQSATGIQTMAGADVCLTLIGMVPVPIPYPNTATMASMPGFPKVLITGGPALNLTSIAPTTNGDQAGFVGGVASGSIMGPGRHVSSSGKVLMGPAPVTRMHDPTIQNGTNASGMALGPAQTKVMVLS